MNTLYKMNIDELTASIKLNKLLVFKLKYNGIYVTIHHNKIHIQFSLLQGSTLHETFDITDAAIDTFCNHLKSWEIPYEKQLRHFIIDQCYFESLYCLFRFTV